MRKNSLMLKAAGLLMIFIFILNIGVCINPVEVEAKYIETEKNDFYQYSHGFGESEGYHVALTDEFKKELNNNGQFTGRAADGNIVTWKAGDPLPNPAPDGEYQGVPVTSMQGMFFRCTSARELDLSRFDTSNIVDIGILQWIHKNFDAWMDHYEQIDLSSLQKIIIKH